MGSDILSTEPYTSMNFDCIPALWEEECHIPSQTIQYLMCRLNKAREGVCLTPHRLTKKGHHLNEIPRAKVPYNFFQNLMCTVLTRLHYRYLSTQE